MEVERFQELARILDATLAKVNYDGFVTGRNAESILRFLIQFPGMKEYVGSEYHQFVTEKLALANETSQENVREPVKSIYVYPKKLNEYEPWIKVDVPELEVEPVLFDFDVVDGKLYASQTSGSSLTQTIYDQILSFLPSGIVPNTEGTHITLINSNVVAQVGMARVEAWLDEYKKDSTPFTIELGDVLTTVSNDYAAFSSCYVVKIESESIRQFMESFNQTFGTRAKPSIHLTFGTKPRSLF